MNAIDTGRLITTLQYGVVVASMAAALTVCLWKRNLSPWMYGVALGMLGVISSRTIYILASLTTSVDDFTMRGWIFAVSSILGTLASVVFSLCLIGLFLDVSNQMENWRELHSEQDQSVDQG